MKKIDCIAFVFLRFWKPKDYRSQKKTNISTTALEETGVTGARAWIPLVWLGLVWIGLACCVAR